MPDPTVHVVVIAAVMDAKSGLLLVQKRDDGRWGCPQGWMRPGESIKETAKRKVSEETGVLVSVESLLATRSQLVSDDPPTGNLEVLVKCRPLAGAPRPGICEIEAAYHAVDHLPDLRDGMKDWLVSALNGDAGPLE